VKKRHRGGKRNLRGDKDPIRPTIKRHDNVLKLSERRLANGHLEGISTY
jgi:hypothetical protein